MDEARLRWFGGTAYRITSLWVGMGMARHYEVLAFHSPPPDTREKSQYSLRDQVTLGDFKSRQ